MYKSTAVICAPGGDTAAQTEAGEGGERAKWIETEHRSIGEQGGSLCLCHSFLGGWCLRLVVESCRLFILVKKLICNLHTSLPECVAVPSLCVRDFLCANRLQSCWLSSLTRGAPVNQLPSCWKLRLQRDSAWRGIWRTYRQILTKTWNYSNCWKTSFSILAKLILFNFNLLHFRLSLMPWKNKWSPRKWSLWKHVLQKHQSSMGRWMTMILVSWASNWLRMWGFRMQSESFLLTCTVLLNIYFKYPN